MLSFLEIVVFVLLLIFTIYAFFKPVILKYKLIKKGQPEDRSDQKLRRIKDAVFSFIFLTGSIRKERPITGIVHSFILFGSLTFDTVTVSHIIEGFNPQYHIGSFHSYIADLFAILVLFAMAYFIIRRFIFRPPNYTYSTNESAIIYTLVTTVTITFLLYEAAAISLRPEILTEAFFGTYLAGFLPASQTLVSVLWWIHIINVFVFVIYVPRSKYMHMFTGPINHGFQNYESKGKINKLDIEDEDAEVFGSQHFTDFKWKDSMDAFSCIDCGRCDDYCPALNTEKALSPKKIVLKIREGLLSRSSEILNDSEREMEPIMKDIYDADELWACTTCGACMQVCPMKIEHVPKIITMRQGEVLMEGKFPAQAKNFMNGLNTTGDPWKLGGDARMDWADGIEVPTLKDNPDTEYLLFVGCAATFDANSQKISRSLVNILNKLEISYAVLGKEEKCCGETARRLGEEALGQEYISNNVELFKSYNIKKILTPCPHCFNTFKNEYPEFGGNYEVIHHSEFLAQLIKDQSLTIGKLDKKITIHDSCYLGRMNSIYEPPREILNSAEVDLVEHEMSKDHSFCCGAGGGKFWFEEKGEKINHKRIDMLMENNPEMIAVSCPYCMRMLSDGLTDKNLENVEVADLANIIEQNLK